MRLWDPSARPLDRWWTGSLDATSMTRRSLSRTQTVSAQASTPCRTTSTHHLLPRSNPCLQSVETTRTHPSRRPGR
eukprot:5005308-Prymnesium_polylepis.1